MKMSKYDAYNVIFPTLWRPSFLILIFLIVVYITHAQELPKYTTPKVFDYSVSHRQSVCDRQEAFHNRTVELRDALAGLQLRPWMPLNRALSPLDPITGAVPISTNSDNGSNDNYGIDRHLPGLVIEILDEVARRGKFTWRDSFGVVNIDNVLQVGKNFDDVLVWALETYDIASTTFLKTFARINKGASFPEGYFDASVIMVAKKPTTYQAKLDLWSFLEPFSWQVWLMILITFVISGMVYLWMEWINEDSDRQILGNKPTETIYFAALTFVGDNKFQPKTDFARLFIAALSFFSLMLASAYTANLASFLVVQNTPSFQIQSLQDAVRNNFRFCVASGTAAEALVLEAFPQARLYRIDASTHGEEDLYLGVVNGKCKIAITSVGSWDSFKGNSTANPGCQLEWVGRVFKFVQGGFVTKSDSGTLCTSLIRDVFDLHLIEMEEDGFTKKLIEKYQEAQSDQQCDALSDNNDESTENDGSSRQLGLQDMGGLFIVFYSLVLITMFMAMFVRWRSTNSSYSKGSNKDSQESQKVSPRSDRSSVIQARSHSSSFSSEDALIAQLSKLQHDLDEAMRQATLVSSVPKTRKSVYTDAE